jgi:prevent-host-death family protein
VQEAQQRLEELLSDVADGVEVILTKDQTPLARIVSLAPSKKPRIAGLHAGAGWVSEDFDKPMPADFWVDTATPPKPRVAGLHPGSIWTSDDFDDPLPDEFWLGTP